MTEKTATRATREVEERFWTYVDRAGPDECWSWLGGVSADGYGGFSTGKGTGKKTHRAHRFAYMLVNGPIGEGMHILHSCDHRLCCNPSHLSQGTNQDNVRDRNAKGRGTSPSQWDTVAGALARCSFCEWSFDGDGRDHLTVKRAQIHADRTGHPLVIQRRQIREIKPSRPTKVDPSPLTSEPS